MKRIITLYDKDNLEKFFPYVDGFIVGSELFATRLTRSFSISDINEIIEKSNQNNKEIFLMVNQMFTDHQLIEFIKTFKTIEYLNLTGVVVADLGTVVELINLGIKDKIIYNPETLLTNTIDFNFLSSEGIKGAYVAKEITLEDILTIGANKNYQLFMVGHGHLNMFYSKRKLLDNYQELTKSELDYTNLQNLKIVEPKRKDSPYPIYQDKAGTHVFRSKVMNSFTFLEELKTVVDYFIIDTIFKNDDYGLLVAKLYRNGIDPKNQSEIEDSYHEKWDNGFLDNKTYYKRGRE
ncbi:peptidase U32 family protein [Haploplasma axanthum]|uniref:Putative protease n=1 Tax=Haploplasma axanthum TaxID=29552 RepID=A0A449BE08_HAPAX|nr:U32 family peptidase [Haploplasma axanthum]VEU80665.1 putative protease [Haploplasma axanthum]